MRANRSRRRGRRGLLVLALLVLNGGLATTAQAKDKGGLPIPLPGLGDPGGGSGDGDRAGGNSDDQPIGAIQIGPVTVDPAAVVANTPLAGVVAETTGTIGQAVGDSASQSGGVVQIGGDSPAAGSTAIVRISSPKAGTHAGPSGSTGSIAIGGGNRADGSIGSVQSGPPGTAPTPLGPQTTGAVHTGPTTVGSRAAATGGSAGPGGAPVSGDEPDHPPTGRSSGGVTTGIAGSTGGSPATAGSGARPAQPLLRAAPAPRGGGGVTGEGASRPVDHPASSPFAPATDVVAAAGEELGAALNGTLPFTGLALWFVLAAAAGLLICGRVLR
jgi:hypothetical protein